MKKQLLCLLTAAMLLLAAAAPVFAEDGIYIYDTYGLLTDEEAVTLQNRAQEISEEYDCGVYIVTVADYSDYGRSVRGAAENIFRDNEFGLYNDNSGILLLLSMDDRDYFVYTNGYGTYTMSQWGDDNFDAPMLSGFRANDWYAGFEGYLDSCDAALEYAGTTYDPADYDAYGNLVSRGPNIGQCIATGVIVGVIGSFIICMIMRRKMRSVAKATSAANYVLQNSLNIYQADDVFTHTTQTRVKIESDSSRSGGGGRPSGGGGGHGGKF